MSEDRITCTLCGLSWTVPENLELNRENHEKFKCLCQKPPGLGYHFIKCSKHNFGQWIRDTRQWKCRECEAESLQKRSIRFTNAKFEKLPNTITGYTPYEMDQIIKSTEAAKT
ncbi:MAG: hypothetical protein KGI28_01575 [Thaumarchaeota archaeon]|nr:hypothetical protein [Nitrososphaerota archaeon]